MRETIAWLRRQFARVRGQGTATRSFTFNINPPNRVTTACDALEALTQRHARAMGAGDTEEARRLIQELRREIERLREGKG